MNRSTVANRGNLELLEANHQRWRNDPESVDESWRIFFEGYELGVSNGDRQGPPADLDAARSQAAVTRLIDAYREIGHYLADLDPLRMSPLRDSHELLEPAAFGLTEADLDRVFYNPLTAPPQATLRTLIGVLRATYCGKVGVEFMHIRNPQVRAWLLERMEPVRNDPHFDIKK